MRGEVREGCEGREGREGEHAGREGCEGGGAREVRLRVALAYGSYLATCCFEPTP